MNLKADTEYIFKTGHTISDDGTIPLKQMQEIVRCKDCEYWECGTDVKGEIYKKYLCDVFECGTTAYDFCSNGVSKIWRLVTSDGTARKAD